MKEIYQKVHLLDSSIGQATVYRNVNKLVEKGEVKKLSLHHDLDRYDGDIKDHYHFVCTSCNKIIDIYGSKEEVPICNIVKDHNIVVDDCDITLYGTCEDCLK